MTLRVLTAALVALSALPAYASEAEPAGLSPFAGDFGNALWTVLIFVLVIVVLGKFAWGPILGMLKEREDFIRKSLHDAKHDRDEAEARLKEYTSQLQSARTEAASLVENARRDADRLREELRQKAKAEADALVSNAERQIQLERDRALAQIRTEAVDLSVAIASKLIGRNLSRADNERLIEDALKQVEARH